MSEDLAADDDADVRGDAEPQRRDKQQDGGQKQGAARDDQAGEQADKQDGKQDGKDQKKKKSSKLPLIILGVVVLLAAIGGFIYWFLHRNQTDTDDAFTNGRAVMIAAQVNGYVTVLGVNDNQHVKAGDLLVQIDPRPYQAEVAKAQGDVEQAQAQLESARLALVKAKTQFPAQLAQAQGQLAQAQGQLYTAQTDYKRQHAVSRAATTQQNVDQSTAALRTAEGGVQTAQAQVDVAKLFPQDIDQAAQQVKQLDGMLAQKQAVLETAKVNLAFTHITAPQDGWVTKRNVEMGNYLQSGTQIMAIVTPDVWVTANFKETQLNDIRPGQKVDIEVDAYPGLKLRGHVQSIQLGSGSKFSAFPPENATGNFVKIVQRVPVKIVIDSGLDPNRPLPLGISVVPTVFLK